MNIVKFLHKYSCLEQVRDVLEQQISYNQTMFKFEDNHQVLGIYDTDDDIYFITMTLQANGPFLFGKIRVEQDDNIDFETIQFEMNMEELKNLCDVLSIIQDLKQR